jgi:cobalt-zinc-cadmium efflux system membrane fusion protein
MLALAALGVACGRQTASAPVAQQQPPPERPTPPAAAGLLRLDPAMLRDLRMTTAVVERRTASAEVDMLGEIGVDRERYAEVAPPIDAQVVRLLVPVNGVVSQGQTLAELRSPELGRARADLITAAAHVRLASQTLERKRTLAAERIVPARELQEAESQMQEAQASLRAVTAALRALGATAADDAGSDDSAQFFVRAPIGGTVLERLAVTGQFAQSSQPLYRIADLRRVWLTVHAFERDAVQLARRTSVRITLAATPGREFQGEVAAIGSQVDPASRTLDVRIDLANPDGLLRPGMSATAHVPIQAGNRELMAVPAAAVQRVGEDWLVFIPRGEGAFEMRRIGRGRDLGTEVEVVSGLRGQETVVVDGAFLLKAEAEKSAGGNEHEHEE